MFKSKGQHALPVDDFQFRVAHIPESDIYYLWFKTKLRPSSTCLCERKTFKRFFGTFIKRLRQVSNQGGARCEASLQNISPPWKNVLDIV